MQEIQVCPTCRNWKIETEYFSPRTSYTITPEGIAALRAWEAKQ